MELAVLSLLLVGLSALFYVFVKPSEQVAERAPALVQAAAAPAAKSIGTSVAVLPFLNLSGDPKEEYFSDGMTEEITSALAKIPNLPVVGRTSAFQFKGKTGDLRAIGRTLSASYVLEGSVRQAGKRVRITAQLIKAESGDHVWTDSYDLDLKDVFAVQEDVAKAIAGALRVPLGLNGGERLVANRDVDPRSYEDYLRARAIYRARGNGQEAAGITLLEQVVARQPNYAPAWALLAQSYAVAAVFDPDFYSVSADQLRHLFEESARKAENAAERAIQLDPQNADAIAALGTIQRDRGKMLEAEQRYQQSLRIDPLNPETLHEYSIMLAVTGHIKEALPIRDKLFALEPLVSTFNAWTARVLSSAGENVRALAIAKAMPLDRPGRARSLAIVYAAMKKYPEAANALLTFREDNLPPGTVEAAARLLRNVPARITQKDIPDLGRLDWVFADAGLPERALENSERIVGAGDGLKDPGVWSPAFQAARKTDRFKALVRKAGLVEYWRARGWPQYCHPTTGDDFACN
ncbi:MAG: hypothetical protein JO256_11360 [Alphaproteobacteria bacterium]|nr:hypothetical protein [Alphaproteobacteria bacterium]